MIFQNLNLFHGGEIMHISIHEKIEFEWVNTDALMLCIKNELSKQVDTASTRRFRISKSIRLKKKKGMMICG